MEGIGLLHPNERAGPLSGDHCRPVGWVFSPDYVDRATCFLVHDHWIATAGHVFERPVDAADAVVVFNHLTGVQPADRDCYALCPEGGFITAYPEIDFCMVRVCAHDSGSEPPGQRWGTIALADAVEAMAGTPLVCVQHSDLKDLMDLKSFSVGQVVGPANKLFIHSAPSSGGTSGAPLLDESGRLVGIHKGEAASPSQWKATRATSILEWLGQAELPVDLRAIMGGR